MNLPDPKTIGEIMGCASGFLYVAFQAARKVVQRYKVMRLILRLDDTTLDVSLHTGPQKPLPPPEPRVLASADPKGT